MENKECIKCKKTLPEDYKYKKCEACRNAQVQGVKKGLKLVGGVVGTVACVAVAFVTNGKINPKR